jgi:serine/threonine-protein kinase RsbT
VANDPQPLPAECRVVIRSEVDIVTARQQGRALAQRVGFTGSDLTVIATAISELGRNILIYAGSGEIVIMPAQDTGRRGLVVVARDEGPGIADVALALQDGYSTSNGLGLGLPGTRRLMDELEVESALGHGTTVTARKWV